MAAVVAIAAVSWARTLVRIISYGWIAVTLGWVLAFASLCSVYWMLDRLTMRKLHRGICPKCGGELQKNGGGFYDGMTPQPYEPVIYALTLFVALSAFAIVRAIR